MACTWISVTSLLVLIIASFMANMKATTHSSSTDTKQELKTIVKTSKPTISSTGQLSADKIVTTDVSVVTESNHNQKQETTIERENNDESEISNCTFSEYTTTQVNFSDAIASSSVTSFENYPQRRLTYRDYPEYTRYNQFMDLAAYLSNIPGFITNPLTIIIAVNIKPIHTSEIYMIVLGCADLVTVTARFTIRMLDLYVETRSSADCKLLWYILTVNQIYSNLILVSWTIERFIAVMFPIKLASWCSIRNTKITAVLLLLFCLAVSTPYIKEGVIVTVWNGREIVNVCSFSVFMYSVWSHVESVYYIYIPMTLMCTCNLAILCRLRSMSKARICMASNQEIINKKAKENRKMTILLLTITSSFLVLHIPYATVMVFNYFYPNKTTLLLEDPHFFSKFILYTTCGYYVTEFQNTINFFLYCISGTKFRTTFRKMICKQQVSKGAETT